MFNLYGTSPRASQAATREHHTAIPETKDDLIDKFLLELGEPHYEYDKTKTRDSNLVVTKGCFELFPINAMPELERTIVEDEISNVSSYKLRFVVDADNRLLFSFDGRGGGRVPYHSEMTNRCQMAGDVELNEQGQIKTISNLSGHFNPNWVSLVHLLKVLCNFNNKIADDITIKLIKFDVDGNKVSENDFTFNKSELEIFADPNYINKQANAIRSVQRGANAAQELCSEGTSVNKRPVANESLNRVCKVLKF